MQAKALAAALAALATVCPSSWAQDPVPLPGFQVLVPDLDFYTLAPCRAVDTRAGVPLSSGSTRTFQIAGVCEVPDTAKSLAINVTVVEPTADGFVTLWPADLPEPATSTINFGPAMTRANNAVVPLAIDGSGGISAKAFLVDSGSVHLIIDVAGYMAGAPVDLCQCPTEGMVVPMIFSVNPLSGSVGSTAIIAGKNFAPSFQVLFGDATAGSSAPITQSSSTFITVTVPPPPPSFIFFREPCDSNGDGLFDGTRNVQTPISVHAGSLDGTSCVATLNNAFTLNPIDTTCTGSSSNPAGAPHGPGTSLSAKASSDIAGSMAGESVTQCQCPTNGAPLPQISGVNPLSGSVGSTLMISGQGFASNVQVLFGDVTTGSSAAITSHSSTSITGTVPTPPFGFTFFTEPCDGNGDGIASGTRNIPTPITMNVRNLDGTGCVATLSNAFMLSPHNTTCTGDNSTPPLAPQGSGFEE